MLHCNNAYMKPRFDRVNEFLCIAQCARRGSDVEFVTLSPKLAL